MILDWFLIRNASLGFDFNAPVGVEQGGYHDHRGGGTDESEELAVDAAGGLPVFSAGEVHTGAVDVLDRTAGIFERGSDEGEALVGLLGNVGFVCAHGAGAGDMDVVSDADGAGEADDGLEGRCTGDVRAFGHQCRMPSELGLKWGVTILGSCEPASGLGSLPMARFILATRILYRGGRRFRIRVLRVFRGLGRALPAVHLSCS